MSDPVAAVKVTLPKAPTQVTEQVHRIVSILGTLDSDGSQTVAVESIGPLTIKVGLNSTVTVSVVEIPKRGKQSSPAAITFTPADLVEAKSADPAGFTIEIVSIVDAVQVTSETNVSAGSTENSGSENVASPNPGTVTPPTDSATT